MKKNYKNRIVVLAITVILCLSFSFNVSAQNSNATSQNISSGTTISPRFTSIIYCYNNLTLKSGANLLVPGKQKYKTVMVQQ